MVSEYSALVSRGNLTRDILAKMLYDKAEVLITVNGQNLGGDFSIGGAAATQFGREGSEDLTAPLIKAEGDPPQSTGM